MRTAQRGSLAVLALAVGLLVAILAAAVSADAGPGGRAAEMVPASALAYARVDTADPALARLAPRIPGFASLRTRALAAAPLVETLRPSLGGELAAAVVDLGGGRSGPLVIAKVRDDAAAKATLDREARGRARYGDVVIRRVGRDAAAFVDGYLVAGPELAVQKSIDAAGGDARALADVRAFERALRGARRPAELYLAARALRAAPAGWASAVAAVLGRPGLRGIGVAAGARGDALRLRVRTVGTTLPGGGAVARLAARVPDDAIAMLGGPDAGAVTRAAERAGAQTALDAFRALLSERAAIDADQDLLRHLDSFVAWVAPGETPVVGLAARTGNPKAVREALARLQGPVAQTLASDAPRVFDARELAGADAYTLRVTDGFAPTYAVAGDTVVLATAPEAVERFLARGGGRLEASKAFRSAIPAIPTGIESLGFFDVRQLLALGEQSGLAAESLRPVRAASAVIQREEDDTTAELFFEIP